jgi:D-glycero-alpha-D-manno-heptose-7-phosphate kinase
MHVAVAGALAAWTGRTLPDDELLALVMNIEAQVINVPTGSQDYRPALYGGVSAVELGVQGVKRVGLGVDAVELGKRIVLAYTGASRQSGINNWDVMVRRINGDPAVVRAFDGIRDAATGVRAALERRQWHEVAGHVANEWNHRKQLAPAVSTPEIDGLLSRAHEAGALAGKVCGAGGGGCLFCLVEPDRHQAVASALAAGGAMVLPFTIDTAGLVVERS